MLDTSPRTFTIYTEDTHRMIPLSRAKLHELIARYFDGATITYGDGLYAGGVEHSATITIMARTVDLQTVVNLAGDIKYVFGQSAVIVESHTPTSRLTV